MTKDYNKEQQRKLKEFKKGNRLPEDFTAIFDNGIDKEDIYSNSSRNCGNRIGEKTVYAEPKYDIYKNNENLFSIETCKDSFIVTKDLNSEEIKSWKEGFDLGLDFCTFQKEWDNLTDKAHQNQKSVQNIKQG